MNNPSSKLSRDRRNTEPYHQKGETLPQKDEVENEIGHPVASSGLQYILTLISKYKINKCTSQGSLESLECLSIYIRGFIVVSYSLQSN